MPYQNEEVRTNLLGTSEWYATIPGEYSPEAQRIQEEEWVLTTKLGPLGAQRVRDFQTYPSYWGDGTHRSYSPGALRRVIRFLKGHSFPLDQVPSIFFTHEGGFELEWESESGQPIQVEFAPDRIEVFHAEKGIERELAIAQWEQLLTLLD